MKKFTSPDVSKSTIEELSARLIEANKKLVEEESHRTMMIENISHDLRAPLTAIRSCVELMESEFMKRGIAKGKASSGSEQYGLWEEMERLLHIMDSRTLAMESLVDNLYYLAGLENGRYEPKLQKVPIDQFLEEYYYSIESDSKYAHKKLELDIDEGYAAYVNIDPGLMTRVLDNLFTNAGKYSEDDAMIRLSLLGAADNKSCTYGFNDGIIGKNAVIFAVTDSGIGIPEGALEDIFERTYMVSDARTPTGTKGSGLGLAIAREIVSMHNGTIWCESKVGEGSSFYVCLPAMEK
ncbi:sensor histidine kinase [Butyrivibrio sp. MC2013]|uniref:sensor histidine kinase n=1 Tax=Butyrivibrio sp. MC2013 TaxID=1280686 RepID=UPI00040B0D5F|nr:HAMP domain-containing sensor histidine kinase [Butyrivibrio sp. MC2013]